MTSGIEADVIDRSRHERYMQLAMVEAKRAARGGNRPFGPVIVDSSGAIVIAEHNRVVERAEPSAHAEVCAIRELRRQRRTRRLDGFRLYTNAEPCPMCFQIIVRAGIIALFYGAPSEPGTWPTESMEEVASQYGNHRIRIHRGILGDEAVRHLRSLQSRAGEW